MTKHLLIISIISLFFALQANAQQIKENEIVVIKGEKFVLHQIRTGETFYSVAKKYKTDSLVLVKNNPELVHGLKIGEIIKIPYNPSADLSENNISGNNDPTKFVQYKIESRRETPYFISKKFNISVEQLYAYNPEVRRFRKGKTIRIPVWDETISSDENENIKVVPVATGNNELHEHEVVPGETLYAISKRYGISESELLFYNPGAKKLKAGSKIYIPSKLVDKPKPEEENVINNEIADVPAETAPAFFNHIIESGQTLWGTARKYGVSEKEITALNPVLQAGFQAGMVIKIPVDKEQLPAVNPVNESAFEKHYVEKGETLFGLSAEYNLKISEIKKYNPILEKRNLIYGETILIPKKPDEEIVEFMKDREGIDSVQVVNEFYKIEVPVEVPETCLPIANYLDYDNKVYDVALFLPLFLEANDTLNKKRELLIDSLALAELELENEPDYELIDSLVEETEPEDSFIGFYADTENYIEFYEGVLLAIDTLQKAGMNIRLKVFDTQRNPDSIRNVIYDQSFLETDLIIGPVFENVQKELADIAAKNRIPLISPLVSRSSIINSNPYFFQVNPSRDYLAVQTAEMIAEEYMNSNFIVMKTGNYNQTPEGKLVDLIREKMFNTGFMGHSQGTKFLYYDFENEGPFGLRRILSKRKENVVYIPSSNEGELNFAISNLDNLADKFSITLIGSNRFKSYESIDINNYHDLKLEYISPYWVDYSNPNTLKIIEKFKAYFNTEPGNFGMQGYDVCYYFLNAIKTYGKEFAECVNYIQPELLQGTYQFEKHSQFGGFSNVGVSVIKYNRDYTVTRTRIKGRYRLAQKLISSN